MRFIGDRIIQEKDFGRIQIDRIAEIQKWADNIKNVQENLNRSSEHYAGFGPGTGLPEAKWEEKEMGNTEKRRSISLS